MSETGTDQQVEELHDIYMMMMMMIIIIIIIIITIMSLSILLKLS
jgi:heme/copper-type cytochrome/quinol oxidase subunit 2